MRFVQGVPLVALALMVSVPMPAGAQELGPYILVDAEKDGDVMGGPAGGVGDGTLPAVDIDKFSITETPSSFEFTIDHHPGSNPSGLDSFAFANVKLNVGGQLYELASPPHEAGVGNAGLYTLDGSGGRRLVGPVPVRDPVDRVQWSVVVNRTLLLDGFGAAAGPGTQFSDFLVETTSFQGRVGPAPFYTVDQVPEAGVSAPPYTGLYGLEQRGNAHLSSSRPVRSSNGEEATFVFAVRATNLGEKSDTFSLSWIGQPAAWKVSVARPIFTLKPGEAQDLNVIVSVPFAHQHGKFDGMRLTMSSTEPNALGQVDLGIRYHGVPQPAGHHNLLTFHSNQSDNVVPGYTDVMGGASMAYANTWADDPEDDGVSVVADSNIRPIENATWSIRLSPSLDIGLQFEPDRTGLIRVPISSPLPYAGATLEAILMLQGPVDGTIRRTILMEGGPTPSVAMMPDEVHTFEVEMHSVVERVPFMPGTEMFVQLRLRSERELSATAAELPVMHPGGDFALPLLEFRDSIDTITSGPQGFDLQATSGLQRIGNPGDAFLFRALVTNEQTEPRTYQVALEGANVDWAEFGPAAFTLESGGSQEVSVIVRIPADATQMQVCDLLLLVRDTENLGNEGLVRFLTQIDTTIERDDDSDNLPILQSKESQESPAPPLTYILAVLAAVLVAARRRA